MHYAIAMVSLKQDIYLIVYSPGENEVNRLGEEEDKAGLDRTDTKCVRGQ